MLQTLKLTSIFSKNSLWKRLFIIKNQKPLETRNFLRTFRQLGRQKCLNRAIFLTGESTCANNERAKEEPKKGKSSHHQTDIHDLAESFQDHSEDPSLPLAIEPDQEPQQEHSIDYNSIGNANEPVDHSPHFNVDLVVELSKEPLEFLSNTFNHFDQSKFLNLVLEACIPDKQCVAGISRKKLSLLFIWIRIFSIPNMNFRNANFFVTFWRGSQKQLVGKRYSQNWSNRNKNQSVSGRYAQLVYRKLKQ